MEPRARSASSKGGYFPERPQRQHRFQRNPKSENALPIHHRSTWWVGFTLSPELQLSHESTFFRHSCSRRRYGRPLRRALAGRGRPNASPSSKLGRAWADASSHAARARRWSSLAQSSCMAGRQSFGSCIEEAGLATYERTGDVPRGRNKRRRIGARARKTNRPILLNSLSILPAPTAPLPHGWSA